MLKEKKKIKKNNTMKAKERSWLIFFVLLLPVAYSYFVDEEILKPKCINNHIINKNHENLMPFSYIFYPMDRALYISLSSFCVINSFFIAILIPFISIKISNRICENAWDEVCSDFIGSEQEYEDYLEEFNNEHVDCKKIFDFGNEGRQNPYVYELDTLYSRDSMSVEEQRQVHININRNIYISRRKIVLYIFLSIAFVLYNFLSLFGYLLIPGEEGNRGPGIMEIFLVIFFIPLNVLLTIFLGLSIKDNYRMHNICLHYLSIITVCFVLPMAIISITTKYNDISIIVVVINWILLLISIRITVMFPIVSGKVELKKHMRHYIRANHHVKRSNITPTSFLIHTKERMRERQQLNKQFI